MEALISGEGQPEMSGKWAITEATTVVKIGKCLIWKANTDICPWYQIPHSALSFLNARPNFRKENKIPILLAQKLTFLRLSVSKIKKDIFKIFTYDQTSYVMV